MMNDIQMHGIHIIFIVSAHQFMDIWVVSTCLRWWVVLLWTLAYKFVCVYLYSISYSWVLPRSRNYWGNQKLCLRFSRIGENYTFLHGSCIVLYHQQQYRRASSLSLTNVCFRPSLRVALYPSAGPVVPHCALVFIILMTNNVEQCLCAYCSVVHCM